MLFPFVLHTPNKFGVKTLGLLHFSLLIYDDKKRGSQYNTERNQLYCEDGSFMGFDCTIW